MIPPMRVFQSGLPSAASCATRLPAPSPANSSLPAVVEQAAASAVAVVGMTPGDLAGLVIDRGEIAAAGADADLFLAAEPHGAARIDVGQVEDRDTRCPRRRRSSPVSGEKAGGSQLVVPSELGETSEPATVGVLAGIVLRGRRTCSGLRPVGGAGRIWLVTRRSPVTRSSVK